MFHMVMSHWDIIQKVLLNTLLVSVPEEIYIVMLTLILIGEFDYWMEDECKKLINRWDYSRILIPSVIVGLFSNIMRYVGLDFSTFSLIPTLLLYILMVLTNEVLKDASALKWMSKAFIFFTIAYISVCVTELIYIPLILYSTGKTIEEINNNISLNFLVSLPAKIMQYSILIYFITKKRTLLKGKIAKHIISSPILLFLTLLIVVLNLLFLFVMYNAIVYEKVLANVSSFMQFSMISGIVLFPILNISALIWSVYYVENRSMKRRKQISDDLHNLLKNMRIYAINPDYDNVKWKLNEIEIAIEQVADSLYKHKVKNMKGD